MSTSGTTSSFSVARCKWVSTIKVFEAFNVPQTGPEGFKDFQLRRLVSRCDRLDGHALRAQKGAVDHANGAHGDAVCHSGSG